MGERKIGLETGVVQRERKKDEKRDSSGREKDRDRKRDQGSREIER